VQESPWTLVHRFSHRCEAGVSVGREKRTMRGLVLVHGLVLLHDQGRDERLMWFFLVTRKPSTGGLTFEAAASVRLGVLTRENVATVGYIAVCAFTPGARPVNHCEACRKDEMGAPFHFWRLRPILTRAGKAAVGAEHSLTEEHPPFAFKTNELVQFSPSP
jgi:hypothetical protein